MKTSRHHYRHLLDRETAHLSPGEAAIRDRCLALAQDYATIPGVIAEAITIKLLTLVEDAPYWLRILVARAALEGAARPAMLHGVAFTSKKAGRGQGLTVEWYETPSEARAALAMMRRSHPDAHMVNRRTTPTWYLAA